MNYKGTQIKPNANTNSGRVRRYVLPGGKIRITQISTFCPELIGPGAVHSYLIESNKLILVDTGLPTDMAKTMFYPGHIRKIPEEIDALASDFSLQELLTGIQSAGYAVEDIDAIVISHGHPDHYLQARSIQKRSNASIKAHILDTSLISSVWSPANRWLSRQPQVAAMGMPPAVKNGFSANDVVSRDFGLWGEIEPVVVDSPVFFEGPLEVNGSRVKGVEAIHMPGHSPGSIGLIVGEVGKERVLLCGDVLLNPITPIPEDLLSYLQTMQKVTALDDVVLVLPAHQKSIGSLKTRVSQLQKHHHQRLKKTYNACSQPASVWDVATIKGYFDVYVDPAIHNLIAGIEVIAHLELLQLAGGIRREHIQDRVHYFVNSGEPFEQVYERVMELVRDDRSTYIMRT